MNLAQQQHQYVGDFCPHFSRGIWGFPYIVHPLLLPGRGRGRHLLAVHVPQIINKQIINKQMGILALTTWQLTPAHSAWHGKEEIIYV